jgi:serine/threonine protein kinase
MSAKLVWKSETSSGAFKFPDGSLHLLLTGGSLDRLAVSAPSRDGVSISLQDNGLYAITACGECSVLFDGESTEQIEVSAKRGVTLVGDECEVEIIIDAAVAIDDPLVGTVIGGHQIIERLGHGGVGIVYRALQLDLQREVALKVLNQKSTQQGADTIEAFKREAIAAGRMSHPNLVQVYSVGEENGVYFFGMEIVDGGDAEAHLERFGAFSEAQAIDVVCQVAEALQYAASNGLVHRDIKPENLMFSSDGRVKLADLGMSSTRELVGGTAVGGTPHFMPPEAIAAPESVDQRSDFYSLGCTLFRLITGATPFSGNSVKEILLAHRDADIPQLSDYVANASNDAQEMVEWLMAKKQDERPQSAIEIIDFCNDVLAPQKRSPILLIAVAVLAIGATAFVSLNQNNDSKTKIVVEKVIDTGLASEIERLQAELDDAERARLEAEKIRLETAAESDAGEALKPDVVDKADAKKMEVATLNSSVIELMVTLKVNEALDRIASAKVDEVDKAKARQSVFSTFDIALSGLEANHQQLLIDLSFTEAETATAELAALIIGDYGYPPSWQPRIGALNSARLVATDAFNQAELLEQRKVFRAQHYKLVCEPLSAFNLNAAIAGFGKLPAQSAPAQYSASANAYVQLFTRAAAAHAILLAKLSSGDVRIEEHLEGKRAFVTKANLTGIDLMLQVRGKRTPRHDSWQEYLKANQWGALLLSAEIDVQSDSDFQALSLLVACAQTAAILRDSSTYTSQQIKDAVLQLQQWELLLTPLDFNSVAATELAAILKATAIISSLNDGKHYSALQLLDLFVQRFSLLAVWSTSGEIAFSKNV